MGAARKIDIHGAKGGEEKPKTPTEAPDSLRSVAIAKMLIAVGEGEFEGTPTDKDIYLDNTPLQDSQGNMNFPNVKWEWRTGAVDQSYIQGIPSIENETTISTELRSGTPWVRAITNTQLSAVRVRFAWPALQSVDSGGNINGYAIGYKVELATDGGAYQEVLNEAVSGKTTSVYERTRRIDLPRAASGWLMRITRLTTNQNNNKISDTMQIAGFTEVIDAKIRYPNTALLYIEFSAEQFRSIPAVTVETKLKKMQVPSNYDPMSRTYSGVWDGTFKQAWTDNAVWMTYDITTADRFGLGRRIKPWMVDKWELYRISQYCDQLVPDGKGGQEPRFICNLNLQSKADAWSLLRDISAIYRGMTYWAQGQVFTLSDMPRATDFDFAYTWVALPTGAAWGAITGVLSAQADLQAVLDAKMSSALADFAIIYPNGGSASTPASIATNTRYITDNPFPGFHVLTQIEILVGSVWSDPGWDGNTGSGGSTYGAISAQALPADKVIVQTGAGGVMANSNLTGSGHGWTGGTVTTAPCRVKVWKVRGAI